MFCGKCGKEISDDSKFCANCGAAISPILDRGTKSKALLPWVLTAVLALVLGLFLYNATLSRRGAGEIQKQSAGVKQREERLPARPVESKPSPTQTRELSTEELFQLASPAVVLIEVFDDEGHKRGLGSGFVVSEDGSVVTNYHVIRGASRATVKFAEGASAPIVGVVGYDVERDVAIVKAGLMPSQTLKLGNSDGIHVGQRLVAIGSPLGFQNTVTDGIVSGTREGYIQMSVPISPGSSGGPVLNSKGEVVGVAVASITVGQNLNFAVPINWAKGYLGTAVLRSLAEITKENMVTERILDGSVSIPAGEKRQWQFRHCCPN